jgi:hypothetical protein
LDDVFILSESADKRDVAKTAITLAKKRFARWYTFRPLKGSLLLDAGISEPLPIRRQSHWTLRYDPSGPRMLTDVLRELPGSVVSGPTLIEGQDIEMAIHGLGGQQSAERLNVAVHEVCHVLFSNAMKGIRHSAAMNEIAAISCESEESVSRRLISFKKLLDRDRMIPWDQFLQMDHPIKEDKQFYGLLDTAARKAETNISFTLDNQSNLGEGLELFYSQSAAFVRTWRMECDQENILHDMVIQLSKGRTFSEWLSTNRFECSPRTVAEFNNAMRRVLNNQ